MIYVKKNTDWQTSSYFRSKIHKISPSISEYNAKEIYCQKL